MDGYEHTHTSVHDGSPAMLVSQDSETITLVNEDGFQWTDPLGEWRAIPPGPSPENDVPRRIAGHALTMEWSGEYGVESSSTGTCKCGKWEESASSQNEVRFEYRMHLRRVWQTRVTPPG